MKKFLKFLSKIFAFIFVTIVVLVMTLLFMINMICNGPSKMARELFVTTFLETGQMKFIVNWFLSDKEIELVVNSNSLKDMKDDVKSELINVSVDQKKENIEIKKVSGKTFYGTMMIINDPSTISLATTYPWTEYGKELGTLVKDSNSIAGINGGLYASSGNTGGRPLGIAVSNGEIQQINAGISGLYLIGFDKSNILRIISLEGLNNEQIKALINKEEIRDAVAFQEEASDKNNHFVKLIINGEKRELKGLGSGANPRTAVGQRKDGSVLFLVTDGRGANGHLGATASDLIEIMDEYGAVNAANIDGGSSSTMYYNNEYLMTSVTFYYSNSSWKLPTAFVVKGSN